MRALALVLVLVAGCKSKHEPTKTAAPPLGSAAGEAAPGDAAPALTLEAEITAIRDTLKLPAVAAMAWRDGTLVEQAAVGVRKAGDTTPVTLDDRWHLGSNTKAMTALLVGIFVDRGTLRWTDTVGQVLGAAKVKIDPGYKDVTLDQLLRHEGGAPGSPPPDAWKQLWADGSKPEARLTFVRAIVGAPPAQPAGTFVYSNAGYMIAGAMLEAKTKKTWEQLIREELFDKLDMKSCGFGAPGIKDVVDQPRGHDMGDTPMEPGPAADNPPGLGPAGTVHCSLADYGKFLNVFAAGTQSIVKPETLQHLVTAGGTQPMGYAGGWMVVKQGQGTMLAHSGSNTMWYATAVVLPEPHVAFVIATNKGDEKVEQSLASLIARFRQ